MNHVNCDQYMPSKPNFYRPAVPLFFHYEHFRHVCNNNESTNNTVAIDGLPDYAIRNETRVTRPNLPMTMTHHRRPSYLLSTLLVSDV